MVLDEYSMTNLNLTYLKGEIRQGINTSLHALSNVFKSSLGLEGIKKIAREKTPWQLLRRDNCHRLGFDFTVPTAFLSHHITLYIFIFFVAVGISCNILAIRVFISKKMRNTSTHIYLIILAVSDSLYLVFLFLSRVLEGIRCIYHPDSNMDIYNHSRFACLSLQYFIDLWSDYSASLILVFTIERFVACYHAVFFRNRCTPVNAKIICGVLFVVQATSIFPHHYLYLKFYKFYQVCSIDLKYENEFTILYMCEAVMFRILPVIIVTVLNNFIIAKIWKLSKKRRDLRRSIRMSQTSRDSSGGNDVRDVERHVQITLMLIVISTCYIITYLPVFVYFFLQKAISNKHEYAKEFVIYCNFSRCLYAFGHSVNFFLYTTSADAFRKQLKTVLCPVREPPAPTNYQPVNNPANTGKHTSAL